MRRISDYSVDRKTILVRLIVALFLIGAGFALGRWSAPDSVEPSEREDAPPGSISEEALGPRDLSAGVPVGYARTEDGALQAALNYARALGPDPGESKSTYAAKLRAIASDEWGAELLSTIASWDEGEAEAAPLRFRITEFSEARAEVVLWVAGVINPRNGSPGAVWGRTFLTLVWEDGDWKVAAEDGDAGPWPAPLSDPSTSADFSALLTGFEAIEYEPASLP